MNTKDIAASAVRCTPELYPVPAPEATVAFTVVTSRKTLTKSFSVGADGKPVKSGEPSFPGGIATRKRLWGTANDILSGLREVILDLTDRQALILVPPPPGKDEWPILTKAEARGRPDVIARSKSYFELAPDAAILPLDFDIKDYPPAIWDRLNSSGSSSLSSR
jgi:hypothetical protein